MNTRSHNRLSRHWRKPTALLAALGAALATLALASTAAMASVAPAAGPADGAKGQETFPPEVITVSAGMPGWEITVIAAGSALVAAVLAVLAYRFWAARRLAPGQQLTVIPVAPEAADEIAQ